ncbi:hypothetical protein E2C01_019293 [Portunus trituberculatus]|uniref:Uncharacterized protein n=1 Tax=Portunus trituberculatus TaxID=210409 RepID=A0A5B7DX72_PORTR|nr:hypothetical protein [Portunus trituberculatus]
MMESPLIDDPMCCVIGDFRVLSRRLNSLTPALRKMSTSTKMTVEDAGEDGGILLTSIIIYRYFLPLLILTGNDDEGDDEPHVDETDEDDLANHEQHTLKQELQEERHTDIHCAGRSRISAFPSKKSNGKLVHKNLGHDKAKLQPCSEAFWHNILKKSIINSGSELVQCVMKATPANTPGTISSEAWREPQLNQCLESKVEEKMKPSPVHYSIHTRLLGLLLLLVLLLAGVGRLPPHHVKVFTLAFQQFCVCALLHHLPLLHHHHLITLLKKLKW